MSGPGDAPPPGELDRLIAEQMADALIFADRHGIIRRWNAGAERVFGFRAAEAVGSSLDLIVPEPLRPPHWDGFNRAVESSATRLGGRAMVTRSLNAAGETIYVDMSFALVVDATGTVLGAVAVARDATRRHLDDKALRQRLAQLEHRD